MWHLDVEGVRHEVQLVEQGWRTVMSWSRDGEEIATDPVTDGRPVLVVPGVGAVGARTTWWGTARRVTLHLSESQDAGHGQDHGPSTDPAAEEAELRTVAWLGAGGVDLIPARGSRAARREAWIREHPHLHTLRQVGIAVAAVLVPMFLLWLLSHLVLRLDLSWPTIPWPSIPWPTIPWPTIPWPTIPWPEIRWPSIPWPTIRWPAWSMPSWWEPVRQVLRYTWPVLLGLIIARTEIRRRRRQDDLRTGARGKDVRGKDSGATSAGPSPRATDEGRATDEDAAADAGSTARLLHAGQATRGTDAVSHEGRALD